MKKLISMLTVIALCVSISLTATGCLFDLHIYEGGGGDQEEEIYVFDETHHWIEVDGGASQKDYAEHSNPESGTGVGKCVCGYYFPCHNLVYEKATVNGTLGYKVVDYDEDMSPNFYHVEIPEFYQGEGDSEPLPVLSVDEYALSNRNTHGKCDIKLESIKLNEGLLLVGRGAFSHSNIKEITIPDTVEGELNTTFMQCISLEKIVIGNKITNIKPNTFNGLTNCHTVIFGDSVKEIWPRAFYNCGSLRTVILPESLDSMPENSIKGNAQACQPLTVIIPGSNVSIFFHITREQLGLRTIPVFQRDANGNLLDEDGNIAHEVEYKDGNYIQKSFTTYGLNANWYGSNTVYCLGEWEYDENNVPQPK